MFKIGIITDQVSMDFEEALQIIKEFGVRYIEIHSLWNKTIEELARLMGEENPEKTKGEHTSTVIKEILDILEEKNTY